MADESPAAVAFRARVSAEPALVTELIARVDADPVALEELVEPVILLGAADVLDALDTGRMRVRDAEITAKWEALTDAQRAELPVLGLLDLLTADDATELLGPDGVARLVELSRAGWVVRDPSLRVPGPERIWLRSRVTEADLDRFAVHMEGIAAQIIQAYRETRTHSRTARRYRAALLRAAEHRGSLVLVDAYDRVSAMALYRDPELAAKHLLRLEAWANGRDWAPEAIAWLRVVMSRHRRRVGGLEDRVVADLQDVLPQLSGVEDLEARITLADCLGRIGAFEEASEVASSRPEPTNSVEEVASISLMAEVGTQAMLADKLDEAESVLSAALPRARARAMAAECAIITGNLAMLSTIRGDVALGHRRLDAALAQMGSTRPQNSGMAQAIRAALHMRAGEIDALRAVLDGLGPIEEVGLRATLVVLFAAGLAGIEGCFERAGDAAARYGGPIDQAMAEHFLDGTPLPAAGAADSTLRLLGVEPTAPALLVDGEGKWFETGGERVSLERYPIAGRLLKGLATAGRPLPTPDLIEVGWPDESIRPDAAANRLYVALNQMRKLGLRDWLGRKNGGYILKDGFVVR